MFKEDIENAFPAAVAKSMMLTLSKEPAPGQPATTRFHPQCEPIEDARQWHVLIEEKQTDVESFEHEKEATVAGDLAKIDLYFLVLVLSGFSGFYVLFSLGLNSQPPTPCPSPLPSYTHASHVSTHRSRQLRVSALCVHMT